MAVFFCLLPGTTTQAYQEERPPAASTRWDFGGWAGALFQDGNMPRQSSFFNVSALYLYARYKFTDSWTIFTEVELENQPNPVGEADEELLLERAYLEYEWSEMLKLRLGKFNTQAGIIKPLHWDFTIDTVGLPIMETNSYIPAQSVGLEILGTRVLTRGSIGYSLAFSHSDDKIGAEDRIDDARGGGLDIHYERPDRFKIGFSAYIYQDPKNNRRTAIPVQTYFEFYLYDTRLLWRTELLSLQRNNSPDIATGYTKLRYQFSRHVYANYRFDQGDDERFTTGRRRSVQTLTLGLRPTNQVRVKLEYSRDRLPMAGEFDRWSAWSGWLFK